MVLVRRRNLKILLFDSFLTVVNFHCLLQLDKCWFWISNSESVLFFLGRIGIVDHDVVELNNLHRQVRSRSKMSNIGRINLVLLLRMNYITSQF